MLLAQLRLLIKKHPIPPRGEILKPLLHAQLLNDPFGDAALLIEILWEHRALLFDLGELKNIRPAKLLKVSHAFVSHAHIDHFIGFDTLLRTMLNREKALEVFGPPGFLDQVQGKLSGYTWNLTAEYPFSIRASEVHSDRIRSREFLCQERFFPHQEKEEPFKGVVIVDPQIQIHIAHLDHLIPSLAFAMQERFHINIHKDRLEQKGFRVGPWLQELKAALWRGEKEDFQLAASCREGDPTQKKKMPLGALREFVTITSGQKIAYVADCRFTEENITKITALAWEADIFFCEAAFLEKDRVQADIRAHLTARQAGELARRARVKELQIFHFSPKYEKEPESLHQEAAQAFRG